MPETSGKGLPFVGSYILPLAVTLIVTSSRLWFFFFPLSLLPLS